MCSRASILALVLACACASLTWALLRFLFQVRSTAYTTTDAFDAAYLHSSISGKPSTIGTGPKGNTRSEPWNSKNENEKKNKPREQHRVPRGLHASRSGALSPDPSLQICSPGAAYNDFLFSAGRPHEVAEDCGVLGSFVSPQEYSRGRLMPRHHFSGGDRPGMAHYSMAGQLPSWESEWETDSRKLDFQLGLHSPGEDERLVALASDVRRHELRSWCRKLREHRIVSSFSGGAGGTSRLSMPSPSILDLFGLEGDKDARRKVGRGVLRFLPWTYEGVYGGDLVRPDQPAKPRGSRRRRNRGVDNRKRSQHFLKPKLSQAEAEGSTTLHKDSSTVTRSSGHVEQDHLEGDGVQMNRGDKGMQQEKQDAPDPNDLTVVETSSPLEDQDGDEPETIIVDLDGQIDNPPKSGNYQSARTKTTAGSEPTKTQSFYKAVESWWFWRYKLLFEWFLPEILSDPDKIVEEVRAQKSSNGQIGITSPKNRVISQMLSGSRGVPYYQVFGRSLHGDTVFPGSAMIFGQRERLLQLAQSRRTLPPLWPLLLAKSPVLHRFHSEASMTLLSHRYTVSALPSPRPVVGRWSRPGANYGRYHLRELFGIAMSGGSLSGNGGEVGILSHALFGNTISIWINVSFVVGKDSKSSKPQSVFKRTTEAHDKRRHGKGASRREGFTRGDGFYSIDGVAQRVLRDVGDVLLDASVKEIETCANPTSSNKLRWREVLWFALKPEERWGREACPRMADGKRLRGGRLAKRLVWDERVNIPGYMHAQDDLDQRAGFENTRSFWIDPSPVDQFVYDLHPGATVMAVLVQKNPETGATDIFDARNCGPACMAIWPESDPNQREKDVYGSSARIPDGDQRRNIKGARRKRRNSPITSPGQSFSTQLDLWQLRRFVAVWREMVDRPESFDSSILQTDASLRLTGMSKVSSHQSSQVDSAPRIVGVRASGKFSLLKLDFG